MIQRLKIIARLAHFTCFEMEASDFKGDTLKHELHKLLTKKKFQNTLTLKLHSMVDENVFSLIKG